jgi:hypothetical protein
MLLTINSRPAAASGYRLRLRPAMNLGDVPAVDPLGTAFSPGDIVTGAKTWLTPTAAITEIKNIATGTSTATTAHMIGLALVPIAALAILPAMLGGKRRRR